jgi:hypothetical protein
MFIKNGRMFCEKSDRYLYWIVCLHLSVITFRYDIVFPMQKQCYVVQKTINPLKLNVLLYRYNLINNCGLVSPATNEGKEAGLLRHNIHKWNTQLLSTKKTSDTNDKKLRILLMW